jgi:uncharacterized protein YjiS (DUF1127 family)
MPAPAIAPLPGHGLSAPFASAPLPPILARLALRIRRWRLEQATRAAVAELDPAVLRDIGLTRGSLDAQLRAERDRVLLREGAWRNLA